MVVKEEKMNKFAFAPIEDFTDLDNILDGNYIYTTTEYYQIIATQKLQESVLKRVQMDIS